MSAIEIFKTHWIVFSVVVSGAFSGLVWAIIKGEKIETINTRVTSLENKEAKVSCKDCKDNRETCQKHYESELKHGEQAFEEIKIQIRISDEKSEARHKVLIDHLISVASLKHSN